MNEVGRLLERVRQDADNRQQEVIQRVLEKCDSPIFASAKAILRCSYQHCLSELHKRFKLLSPLIDHTSGVVMCWVAFPYTGSETDTVEDIRHIQRDVASMHLKPCGNCPDCKAKPYDPSMLTREVYVYSRPRSPACDTDGVGGGGWYLD